MKVELVWCDEEEEEGWAESVEDKRRSESEVRELEQKKKKKGLRSFMSEHIAQRLPTSDSSVPLPPSDSEKLNKQKQKQKLPAAERDEKYVVSVCVCVSGTIFRSIWTLLFGLENLLVERTIAFPVHE